MKPVKIIISLFIISMLMITAGCGASSVKKAISKASESSSIEISINYQEAFTLATLSKYCSSTHCDTVINKNSDTAHIWYGGRNNIYAVIKFIKISQDTTKVNFYEYGGSWHECLNGIRKLLLKKSSEK